MQAYKSFPDFDRPFPVEIPEGFVDDSWHQDVCPKFVNEELGLTLWIDYADTRKREFSDSMRYVLQHTEGNSIIHSNDFSDVMSSIDDVKENSMKGDRGKMRL